MLIGQIKTKLLIFVVYDLMSQAHRCFHLFLLL